MRAVSRKMLFWLLAGCALLPATPAHCEWKPAQAPLMTRWAADVNPTNALPEYPRPQLIRDDWMNLNGLWDYIITPDSIDAPGPFTAQILVPFPVESALSGVMTRFDEHSRLWYHRQFVIPDSWTGRRVRLHFGAVDWECHVQVNGQNIGLHQGGYDPFTFDITDALRQGTNDIVVMVMDPTEGDQPRGKQVRQPGNIFYTPTSGIWQTVWLEPVAPTCIDSLHLVPDLSAGGLHLTASVGSLTDNLTMEAVASSNGVEIARIEGAPNKTLLLAVPHAHLWSPDDPFLYDLEVVLKQDGHPVDRVRSYFGMRDVSLQKDSQGMARIALNSRSLFQIGALDQGFWPDGLYTAPTEAAMRYDLEFLKRAGFNLVRKHVKIEPQRWYYLCDKLGLLVWQDMPSANNLTAAGRQQFEIELRRMIENLGNHPAVVQWVVFNEGWGQFDTERLVASVKEADPSRLVDNASGWTDMRVGDVVDVHSYPEPRGVERDAERAAVFGEFGGIGYRVENHSWSSKSWGYKNEKEIQGLVAWYLHLAKQIARLRDNAGFSAAVYTQTTDVETECNGLLTYDRAIAKIDPEVLRAANRVNPGDSLVNVVLPDAISGQAQWRYTVATPAKNWMLAGFDDSSWQTGLAGFGSPGTMGAMVRTLWNTSDIWLRRDFVLTTNTFQHLMIEIHHDEDAEVYINGVLGTQQAGYLVDYRNVEMLPPAKEALRIGTNTIAVHCHQTVGGQYIDVGLIEPPK